MWTGCPGDTKYWVFHCLSARNGALVSAGNGVILVVFGALGRPVTFELDGVLEEGPVCCFVFGEGISDAGPVDGMDKLTHTLFGLL